MTSPHYFYKNGTGIRKENFYFDSEAWRVKHNPFVAVQQQVVGSLSNVDGNANENVTRKKDYRYFKLLSSCSNLFSLSDLTGLF